MFSIKISKPFNEKVVVTNIQRTDYLMAVEDNVKYLLDRPEMIYHIMAGLIPDYRLVIKNIVISHDAIYDCDIEFMGNTEHFVFDAMDLTTLSETTLKTKVMEMINKIRTWVISLISVSVDVEFVGEEE